MVDEKIQEQGQVYLDYKNKFIKCCKHKSSGLILAEISSYLGKSFPDFLKQDEDCCASFLVGPVSKFSKDCKEHGVYLRFINMNHFHHFPDNFEELIFQMFDKELIESKEVALKANTLQFASEQHKKNMGLCLMLAEQKCKDVAKYMDDSLKEDEKLLLDIVELEPANIVHTEFIKDSSFVANSIVRNVAVLKHLRNLELLKEVYEMFLEESRVPEECIQYLEQRISELTPAPKVEKKSDYRTMMRPPIKTFGPSNKSPRRPNPGPKPARAAAKGFDGSTHHIG